MNIYKAFYRGKEITVESDTSYHAQLKAAYLFNAKHTYDVTVFLVEKDGKEIVHDPSEL